MDGGQPASLSSQAQADPTGTVVVPPSSLSCEAPPFVPGWCQTSWLLPECHIDAQAEPENGSGEVISGASYLGVHVNPSPVEASADVSVSVAHNQNVCFQNFDFMPSNIPGESEGFQEESVLDLDMNLVDIPADKLVPSSINFHLPQTMQEGLSDTIPEIAVVSFTSPLGTNINVYPSCISGSCKCQYGIGGVLSQLKPCRFAGLIHTCMGDRMSDFEKLLWGITDGFPIVDQDVEAYECANYSSILDDDSRSKMDIIIRRELDEGMISIVDSKPKCVHALGAVPKASGGIRPITDCSRPLGKSINNFCDSLKLHVNRDV